MGKMSVFEVIAEPNRRTILDLLRIRQRSVSELVEATKLSQPGVSKHLRIMRECKLVESKQVKHKRIYYLCPEPLQEVSSWLEAYQQFWSEQLDSLETVLHQHSEEEREDK